MIRTFSLAILAAALPLHSTDLVLKHVQAHVYFSTHGGCTEAIIAAINSAKKDILVQAYSSTSAPLAKVGMPVRKR